MKAKQMKIIYVPQQSSERSPRRAFFPWQRPEYLLGGIRKKDFHLLSGRFASLLILLGYHRPNNQEFSGFRCF